LPCSVAQASGDGGEGGAVHGVIYDLHSAHASAGSIADNAEAFVPMEWRPFNLHIAQIPGTFPVLEAVLQFSMHPSAWCAVLMMYKTQVPPQNTSLHCTASSAVRRGEAVIERWRHAVRLGRVLCCVVSGGEAEVLPALRGQGGGCCAAHR
jgi:hypothetical protein